MFIQLLRGSTEFVRRWQHSLRFRDANSCNVRAKVNTFFILKTLPLSVQTGSYYKLGVVTGQP